MGSGQELPSGTVTFLFTDIEGSTRLLKQLRAGYARVLAEHQELLRVAFAAHGGMVVDTQGDAFFVVFRRAQDAVEAAIAAQRSLQGHVWPEGVEVRVRMGIHTGQAEASGGRYHGLAVHRAARIGVAAHGGQVLVSQTTRDLLDDEEEESARVSLRDLGEQRLKDLDRPARLYQLVGDGLAAEFPALQTAESLPEEPPVPRERARLQPRLALSTLALVVLAGVGVALFFLLQGTPAGLARVDPNAIGMIDPTSGRILAEVPAGSTPTDAAFGDGSLWVTSTGSDRVLRIDPKTSEPVDTIAVGDGPSGIAFGQGAVWVANSLAGTLSRIDPGTGKVVQSIPVGSNPSAVAVGSGSVWVANTDDRTVTRLDARSGKVAGTSQVGVAARSIAVGGGGVWVTDDAGANVLRLDAKTGAVTDTLGVGNGPTALAFGAGSLWVANSVDGTVSRIDPASRKVIATVEVGDGSGGLAFAAGRLWVSNEFGGTLGRIDPQTNRVLPALPVAERPTAIVAASGRLWVLAGPSAGAHRAGTLTVSEVTPFDSVDPALAYTPVAWSLLVMTNDGLMGFKRVAGAEGGRLVPDLAVSLPTLTEGGRTYRFQLRNGVRYSTGALVRPEDVRRALERVFALRSPGSAYYRGIIGGEACLKRSKRCDLSRGIVVDSAANSMTFHLVAPDPEFLYKLALPFADAVPAETPLRVMTRPLPATGPYDVTAYVARSRLQLGRNPRFREWSRAAQPDGYPNQIIVNLKPDVSDVDVTRVLRGETDFLQAGVPFDRLGELATRYARQLHLDPLRQTVYLFLNTRVRPFDDVRVRRAINFALDRKAFARLIGGDLLVQPTCQILPPNFAGYVRYCPYTSSPNRQGRWNGPNLNEARALIAASGTKGDRIVVWVQPGFSSPGARYLEALLHRLGYRASLKFVSSRTYLASARNSSMKVQIGGFDGWFADYPAASNFVVPTLSCASFRPNSPSNENVAEFCDPAIDAEMKKAKEVEITNPLAGNRLWTRIEHELVDRAPWVPVVTGRQPNLVSKRVGNYEYNPQWGVLIDQLWVR